METKTCENCVWADQCACEHACEYYEEAADAERVAGEEYEEALRERVDEYEDLLKEVND